jgi:D-alanyl-D-alanine carboxypeptidase (penicillin-binding protein 5/6)
VVQSGSCAASCGQDSDGNRYLCVTGDAGSSWRAIYDHVALYKDYCAGEGL